MTSDNAELIARLRARKDDMLIGIDSPHPRTIRIPDIDCQAAADALAKAGERIAKLDRKVYQPGVWRCAKCDFQLVQSTLNANTGAVTARDDPGTKCPNDESPMWRVSYQEDNAKAWKWGEEQFDLRQAAEARASALEARVKALEIAAVKAVEPLEALRMLGPLDISGELWTGIVEGCGAVRAALAHSEEG